MGYQWARNRWNQHKARAWFSSIKFKDGPIHKLYKLFSDGIKDIRIKTKTEQVCKQSDSAKQPCGPGCPQQTTNNVQKPVEKTEAEHDSWNEPETHDSHTWNNSSQVVLAWLQASCVLSPRSARAQQAILLLPLLVFLPSVTPFSLWFFFFKLYPTFPVFNRSL